MGLETADLVKILIDAYEADANKRLDMESQSATLIADGTSLAVAVDAVRAAIAEHHRAQWSELVDQAPAAPVRRTNDEIRADYPPLMLAVFDHIKATYQWTDLDRALSGGVGHPVSLLTVRRVMVACVVVAGRDDMDDCDAIAAEVLHVDDRPWIAKVADAAGYRKPQGIFTQKAVRLVVAAWLEVLAAASTPIGLDGAVMPPMVATQPPERVFESPGEDPAAGEDLGASQTVVALTARDRAAEIAASTQEARGAR